MAPLTLESTLTDGTAVVILAGELDVRGAVVLDPELERLAEADGVAVVILDLRGLEFLDSSGLRSVVAASTRLAARERRLALVRGGETVQRVFAVTRMEERLWFVGSPEEVSGDGGGGNGPPGVAAA